MGICCIQEITSVSQNDLLSLCVIDQLLFRLQLAIARRGCELLKVGGLIVYSTCAMNPIENEAVVAQLLREGKGSILCYSFVYMVN